jgi:flagellar protein FlaJ
MEIKKGHWIGIGLALVVILFSLFLIETKYFFFVFGVGVLIAVFPFVFSLINETKVASEKEEMFLEFTRNLVESVKTGTPISKSIINVKQKSYGILSENVDKLANQISLGIPLNFALEVFAKDINNKTISRAITLIGQAERAGGDIGEILEEVAGAVTMADKLNKERKAAISALVTQGYIIFFVFMIIILVMQFRILPMVSGITGTENSPLMGISSGIGETIDPTQISDSFFYLLLIQGLFSGLTIGKLSEGNIKAGIRHSFALILIAFLFSAGANILFG